MIHRKVARLFFDHCECEVSCFSIPYIFSSLEETFGTATKLSDFLTGTFNQLDSDPITPACEYPFTRIRKGGAPLHGADGRCFDTSSAIRRHR